MCGVQHPPARHVPRCVLLLDHNNNKVLVHFLQIADDAWVRAGAWVRVRVRVRVRAHCAGTFRVVRLGKQMDSLLFELLQVGTSDLEKWAGT